MKKNNKMKLFYTLKKSFRRQLYNIDNIANINWLCV